MIAEESGKWAKELAQCGTKRELDALLRWIGALERVAVHPGEESYEDIARKLGIGGKSDLSAQYEAAVARIHRSRR